jgi:hypothetical protein
VRIIGHVSQDLPEFLDGCVHPMLKINERVPGPEAKANFFPGDDFAWFFKKHCQYLVGLPLQLDSYTVATQLASAQVHLKRAKLHYMGARRRRWHYVPSTSPANSQ